MSEAPQEGKRKPAQPPKPQTTEPSIFYEKYFDPSYQAYYFYNPKDGSSVWEVPPGSVIADMTLATDALSS